MKRSFQVHLLRERDVPLVLAGRALAMAASSMLVVVLQLRVHDAGWGPHGSAALLACVALPSVLAMNVAGRVADGHDSRHVLVVAYLVVVAAAAAAALAPSLPLVLLAVVVFEVGWCLATPVWGALVPRVVGDDRVGAMQGLQMALSAATAPLGAAAGGVLVGSRGPRDACLGVAAVVGVVLVLAACVRTRRRGVPLGAHERSGAGVIRGDAVLGPLVAGLLGVVVAVGGANVVEVYLVRDALGADAAQYGLGEVFAGAGAVVGGIVVGRLDGERGYLRAVAGGLGLTCVGIVVMGVVPGLAWFYAASAWIGLVNALSNGALGTLLVARVPDAQRGRAVAALNGMANAANVVALGLGGIVGAALGPRPTLIGAGVVGAVTIAAVAWRVRGARTGEGVPDRV